MLGRNALLLKKLYSSSFSIQGYFIPSHHLKYFSISSLNHEAPKPHLSSLVNFLISSVGFTKEAAITTLSKVPTLKSTKKPESVINILKQYNLDNTHIKDIICYAPGILTCKPNKTIEPKIKVFLEYGFSESDLVQLIKGNPGLLKSGLHTQIIPVIGFIRRFVNSDEQAIQVIRKTKWLFSASYNFENVSANLLQLQIRGLSNDQIVRLITNQPWCLTLDPVVFQRGLVRVVEELGIPENSKMFVYGIYITYRYKKSTIEKKLKILRDYGWSEEEIATFVRSNPVNLSYSEAKIRQWLDFFMKELGYTPAYLTAHLNILSLSFEKRVKPRYKVLDILKEKKLVSSKPTLFTFVRYSEVKFLQFLKHFETELPGLVKIYICGIENAKLKMNDAIVALAAIGVLKSYGTAIRGIALCPLMQWVNLGRFLLIYSCLDCHALRLCKACWFAFGVSIKRVVRFGFLFDPMQVRWLTWQNYRSGKLSIVLDRYE
ncbi:mitochodrial transcription termination factor [Artemisia annua]|uniref:Mitochodrial transcription termination factor n=1 Tax=Artemisia annua TaxID=35608 RepID=A0A2U1PFS1_ARTAN|nr:mitochodrial transcription termination factor [Artemisia annua]